MKSVLMLYPITPFVDRDPEFPNVHAFFLSVYEEFFTKTLDLGLPAGSFRNRFRLINVLLDRYRAEGYKVGWLLFSNENNPKIPDESRTSDIFQIKPQDYKVAARITYRDHIGKHKYPNEAEVLKAIEGLDSLVVGGFHESDCVGRFSSKANEIGIPASVDPLLTDLFFWKMKETFDHDVYARMISTGHLDPEMHEADPWEEQCLLFNHKLDEELARFSLAKHSAKA